MTHHQSTDTLFKKNHSQNQTSKNDTSKRQLSKSQSSKSQSSKSPAPNTKIDMPLLRKKLRHRSYLTVAKTRATVLGVLAKVMPIPRPLLLVGPNSTTELVELVVSHGHKKVFIVSDAVLNKLGIPEAVIAVLKAHNIDYLIYNGIKPDPTMSVVKDGLALCKNTHCEAIIAIGGGSVIDAAKMIAFSQGNKRSPEKLIGILKGRKPSLPLYVVPTTAGTGSEATIGAVIPDDDTHQNSLVIDPKMMPLAAAIDPIITQGLPPQVTAETGIDALTHGLEAWMSKIATEETDFYAAMCVKNVLTYLPQAHKQGDDLLAREKIGVAAHYGGLALNKAGLGYVHAIAHQLGAYYQVPHGRANAIVLPIVLALNQKACQKRLALLAQKIGLVETSNQDKQYAAAKMTQQIVDLIDRLNIDAHIPSMNSQDFAAMAKVAAKEVRDTYAVPKYIDSEEIVSILDAIMTQSNTLGIKQISA